jgi:hypothetical protein
MKVVAYGGGTNSTAMLIHLYESEIRPDFITFADTGAEKPHTYEHIKIVNEWCKKVGFPEIIIVRKKGKKFFEETLEENCIRMNMLPSIAYGFKSCSQKYKIQPQDMFFNNLDEARAVWASGEKITKLIGYDADEERRAKIYDDNKYNYFYPLIEADWTREDCVKAIERAGLPQPGKSACFFCPSSRKEEILELRQKYPDLLKRALAIEANANLTTIKGLGRNYAWSDLINFANAQLDMFSDSGKDMACGCYDGD